MAMKEGVKARPLGGKRPPKKKVCPFCVNKMDEIDYIALAKEMEKSSERSFKDGEKRTRFITEKGKILPRRMSGVCVKHQRCPTKRTNAK